MSPEIIVKETGKVLRLTVVAAGERLPVIKWYRNGIHIDESVLAFQIDQYEIDSKDKNEKRVRSNFRLKSTVIKSSGVYLAKAAYGDASPMVNTSTFINVWCKY